ncbi:group II intron reverse transcriptase/maturase [Wenyingzhuangia sp. 1_MG-2023]|nr:group II intron reverse transcriptase/maturase [Wenyingzhuangia sp. 1_MG-2023]
MNVALKHVSDTYTNWNSIDWKTVEKKVRLLQSRIVKAKKAGKHRKVKSLQWILVHSYHAKLLAIRKVTGNKGKRTSGVDGEIWTRSSQKLKAALSLTQKGYKASPLKRIYIPKSNSKSRPLGIPTMKDRAMQALYLLALHPVAETTADTNSYGFRPERCCADAIEQCFNVFKGKHAAQWILEADIKGCFDNISHHWLMDNIPVDRKILYQWLKSGIIENDLFANTNVGTPQGGIISPVLANLTLDGLQNHIEKACGIKWTKRGKNEIGCKLKVNFIRYADDFIISAADKSTLQEIVLPAVICFLAERGLEIQPEKTKITHINQGFDFLGQNVRKYHGKLLIKPSKKSIKNFKRKIFEAIKSSGCMPTDKVIYRLNPMIRGWANYHRYVVSKDVFSSVDNDIYLALWQWAKRRHGTKSSHWIRNKYFKSIDNRNWVFAAKDNKKTVELFKMESIPIKRFVKVRNGTNPYDSIWKDYFKARKNSRVR